MDLVMSAFDALMEGSFVMLVSIDLILASLFDSVAALVETLDACTQMARSGIYRFVFHQDLCDHFFLPKN
jgi:hypothetical protein